MFQKFDICNGLLAREEVEPLGKRPVLVNIALENVPKQQPDVLEIIYGSCLRLAQRFASKTKNK